MAETNFLEVGLGQRSWSRHKEGAAQYAGGMTHSEHADTGSSFSPGTTVLGSPRDVALATCVLELEAHQALRGWDVPTTVFALVRTSDALNADPSLAQVLDDQTLAAAQENPEALMAIEQEDLPAASTLEELIAQLAWPQSVDGVAIATESIMLSEEDTTAAAQIEDTSQREAFLASASGREDVRVVAGVLRGGHAWSAVRLRSHDDENSVAQGHQLTPGLTQALAASLL